MAATGLDVFDRTLHTTNTWLDEIMEQLGPDRQAAWHVPARYCMHCATGCRPNWRRIWARNCR